MRQYVDYLLYSRVWSVACLTEFNKRNQFFMKVE